jgi:hypothetical protein
VGGKACDLQGYRVCVILYTHPPGARPTPGGGSDAISYARSAHCAYNVDYVKFIMQYYQWLSILQRIM